MHGDLKGLIFTYSFLFSIVLLGEIARRIGHWSSEFTRKCIHIGVGFWGFVAYWTIDSWWIVMIPPFSFVLINLISYRWNLFPAMEIEDKRNLGTIYYPLSICLLLLIFWRDNTKIVPVVGSMVMGLGDGFASIFGRKWGFHPYRVWGHLKTLEGSIAMFLFSGAAMSLILIIMTPLYCLDILIQSLVIALIGAIIEGLSPLGLDNITVPIGSACCYWILFL